LDLAGKLINGELSEYDYTEANKKYNSIIQREAEKLRQEAIKGLDVTNYDSPYAMGSGIVISPDNIKVNTDYTGLTSKELKENNLLSEDYSFWDSKAYLWGGDSNGIYAIGIDSNNKRYMSEIYGYHVLGALNAGGYIPYSNAETLQILKENPELAESYNANKGRIRSMNDLAFIGSTISISKLPAEEINSSSNNGQSKKWSVDPEMQAKDIKKDVLSDNIYKKNPTAENINNYLSETTNYVKDKNFNGKFMYVIDEKGNIIIGNRNKAYYPHPTLIGGENPQVQSAGMVEIRGGKIYKIDNASGHFKPGEGSIDISKKFFEQLPEKVFSKDFKGYEDYSIKK
jgi:hypothetical protein